MTQMSGGRSRSPKPAVSLLSVARLCRERLRDGVLLGPLGDARCRATLDTPAKTCDAAAGMWKASHSARTPDMTHAGKSSSEALARIRAEPAFVLDADRRCLSDGMDGVVLDGVVGTLRCAGVGGLLDLEGVAVGVFSALWWGRRLDWPRTLERY
jgi:hypothetical protein